MVEFLVFAFFFQFFESCETFEEFYDLFAPVFERNAKWSVKKAPRLPADKADFEKEVTPFSVRTTTIMSKRP